MSWLTVGNTGAVAVCGAVLLAAAPALASSPKAANPHSTQAAAAAKWQAGELVEGGIPGFSGSDWGLTIDTIFALSATRAEPAALASATKAVAANVRAYNSNEAWGQPGSRIAGATAKILVAAVAADRDPTKFGGLDLRQETLDLIAGADAGDNQGRIRDKLTGGDNSNAFAQSLAVLGLARSGEVPRAAVDFLIKQQCPSGGFRLYPDQLGSSGPTCQDTPTTVLDPDSTGMAVQALLAAAAEHRTPGAAGAAKKGADWLKSIQRADGSFGGSGPTAASNTNSTGLAGQALHAAGYPEAADKAATWVLGHQITKDNAGKADREIGTIAYNAEAFESARTDGIEEFQRDQWRRATPQALLVLADVPLGDLGKAPTEPEPSGTTTSGGPTSPGPTSPGPTTPGPSTPGPSTPGPSTPAPSTPAPTTSLTQTASASVTATPGTTTAAPTTTAPGAGTVGGSGTNGGSATGGSQGGGSGGGLAKTGAQIGGLLLLAIGLVGTGFAVRAAARRKNGDHA